MADTEQNFEQVHFETADELMRVLMPACGLDTGTGTPTFIYRGHGDVGWDLIPTALRLSRGGLTQALAHVEPNLQMTADDQVFAEMLLLMALMNSCDRAVIALPGDSHEFRARWMDLKSESLEAALKTPSLWPYEEQLGLLAFAQHHGIPTRLLDWTHSAVVAAYFAAEASWRLGIQADLAVWALNTEYLHVYANLELVQMPGANSVRLGAQRGLFTCVRLTAGRGQPIGDSSIQAALLSNNADPSKPKPLWRLTLPSQESLRLLYLCYLHGVDGSTVFPGPAGAASATLEHAAWMRDDPHTGRSAYDVRPVSTLKVKSQRQRQ